MPDRHGFILRKHRVCHWFERTLLLCLIPTSFTVQSACQTFRCIAFILFPTNRQPHRSFEQHKSLNAFLLLQEKYTFPMLPSIEHALTILSTSVHLDVTTSTHFIMVHCEAHQSTNGHCSSYIFCPYCKPTDLFLITILGSNTTFESLTEFFFDSYKLLLELKSGQKAGTLYYTSLTMHNETTGSFSPIRYSAE